MKQTDYQTEILRDNVLWYVKLRWLYLIGLAVAWLGGQMIVGEWNSEILSDVTLLIVGLMSNLFFYLLARRPGRQIEYYYRIAVAQLAADVTTASLVLYEHGGAGARTIILYSIPIFVSGVLFGKLTLYMTVAAAALAYDLTVLLYANDHGSISALGVNNVVLILFYNTVFLMIGLVAKHSYDKSTRVLTERNKELVAFNEAKDEFISIASHQLRTPATAVKQLVGMMLQGYMGNLTTQQLEVLSKAYASNERQLKIVNDLLQVARVDTKNLELTLENYDMVKLINAVVDEQRGEIMARQQRLDIKSPKKVTAKFDTKLIFMALENIISNAIKYTPSGKSIKVKVAADKESVDIAVKDEGIGLSTQDQKKLFQKFSRIENAMNGTVEGNGLGLYWTKKIIDLHNGAIEVMSKKGRGTTFTITLPR
jgi:signal transduction histidine kinase